MYAIIKTGGKQYKVSEGDEIIIEKLEVEEKGSVTFEEVLGIFDGEKVKVGTPVVKGAKVTATVVKKRSQNSYFQIQTQNELSPSRRASSAVYKS